MSCKCGKHEVERHLLDRETGPGGNQSNGDLGVDSRSTLPRGLDVKFLKDLNREGKIVSQKDLPGDRPLFGLLLRRANSISFAAFVFKLFSPCFIFPCDECSEQKRSRDRG
jgi:hypothetical protein